MNPYSQINPGLMDRKVSLVYPVETRDSAGGVVVEWVRSIDVFADYTPQPGREVQQSGQKLALAVGTFRIRFRRDLTAKWRVLLGDTVFELLAPPVEIGRRMYQELVCRAIATGAAGISEALTLGDNRTPLTLGDGVTPLTLGGSLASAIAATPTPLTLGNGSTELTLGDGSTALTLLAA